MSTEASFGDLPQASPRTGGQEAPGSTPQGGPPGATVAQFEYRGCQFTFCIVPRGPDAYEPHVLYRYGLPGLEQMALPQDTEAYAGVDEAVRHAQQQAVRWVHDRTGDAQGRF
jgi:hypothetical protein